MGYASNQYFTVPYLVLLKAFQEDKDTPSERTAITLKLVRETCQKIMANNDQFKETVLD